MASVVRQLEAAIATALETALDGSAKVMGIRAAVASGLVKTTDGDGRPEVYVAVSPASADSYASPVLTFAVAVSVRLEWEDDPTIAAFDETAAKIEALLIGWNSRANTDALATALTTDNFRCDGFRLGGGNDSVELGGNTPSISTVFNFELKGIYLEPATTTEV